MGSIQHPLSARGTEAEVCAQRRKKAKLSERQNAIRERTWQVDEWALLEFPEHSASEEQDTETEEHAMNSAVTVT